MRENDTNGSVGRQVYAIIFNQCDSFGMHRLGIAREAGAGRRQMIELRVYGSADMRFPIGHFPNLLRDHRIQAVGKYHRIGRLACDIRKIDHDDIHVARGSRPGRRCLHGQRRQCFKINLSINSQGLKLPKQCLRPAIGTGQLLELGDFSIRLFECRAILEIEDPATR
jgi:hypothetical protein